MKSGAAVAAASAPAAASVQIRGKRPSVVAAGPASRHGIYRRSAPAAESCVPQPSESEVSEADPFASARLEEAFEKEHILYLYLNQIYLGSGAYGVEAASQIYFGCRKFANNGPKTT